MAYSHLLRLALRCQPPPLFRLLCFVLNVYAPRWGLTGVSACVGVGGIATCCRFWVWGTFKTPCRLPGIGISSCSSPQSHVPQPSTFQCAPPARGLAMFVLCVSAGAGAPSCVSCHAPVVAAAVGSVFHGRHLSVNAVRRQLGQAPALHTHGCVFLCRSRAPQIDLVRDLHPGKRL